MVEFRKKSQNNSSENVEEVDEHSEVERERKACIDALFEFLSVEKTDTNADQLEHESVLHLLFIVEGKLESFLPGSDERDILIQLRDKLQASESILISNITESVDSIINPLKYKCAVPLLKKLTDILKTKIDTSIAPEILEREKQENEYLLQLKTILKLNECSIPPPGKSQISLIGTQIYPILKHAFSSWHQDHQIFGKITLIESALLKASQQSEKFGLDESIDGKGMVETFLRTVTCTAEFEASLIGQITPNGQGINYQVIRNMTPVKVLSADDAIFSNDIFVSLAIAKMDEGDKFNFLSVPLDPENIGYEGTFDIILTGKQDHFDNTDIKFIQSVAHLCVESIKTINENNMKYEMIESAKKFLRLKSDFNVQIYIGEDSYHLKAAEKPLMFLLDDCEENSIKKDYQGSPYMTSIQSRFRVVQDEHPLLHVIENVFTSGKSELLAESRTGLISILDKSTNLCIAVLLIKELDSNQQVAAEQLVELDQQFKYLENAIDSLAHKKIEFKIRLEGEGIDESSSRKMMFGKYLLEKYRGEISSLSAKSIAELKSYRVPPKSVHKILKAALYIFGFTPKERNFTFNVQ